MDKLKRTEAQRRGLMMKKRQSLGAAFSPQPSTEIGRKCELYKWEETEGEKWAVLISENTQQPLTMPLAPSQPDTAEESSGSRADLEMHEFDDVGVSNVHLVQQAADEALHLPQVAQQTLLLLLFLFLLFFLLCALWALGALHIPQQSMGTAALALLLFCRQANLQKDLHSSTVLGRKATADA